MTDETPDKPRTWQYLGMTWTEADLKSAIITVGGTVLGGLVLVLFIGLALAVAHFEKHNSTSLWELLCFSVFGVGVTYVIHRLLRQVPSSYRTPTLVRIYIAIAVGFGSVSLLSLLILIGIAAGIH